MEFAGVDKSARSKRGGWKMQEWKYRHHVSGVDNAGSKVNVKLKNVIVPKQCVYLNCVMTVNYIHVNQMQYLKQYTK